VRGRDLHALPLVAEESFNFRTALLGRLAPLEIAQTRSDPLELIHRKALSTRCRQARKLAVSC